MSSGFAGDDVFAGGPGAEGKPQFEFGFEPTLDVFVDRSDLDRTLVGTDNLFEQLERLKNTQSARLNTQIIGLKESLRHARLQNLTGITQAFGNLTASAMLAVNTATRSLIDAVESFGTEVLTAAGASPQSLTPPTQPLQTQQGSTSFRATGSGSPDLGEGISPPLEPDPFPCQEFGGDGEPPYYTFRVADASRNYYCWDGNLGSITTDDEGPGGEVFCQGTCPPAGFNPFFPPGPLNPPGGGFPKPGQPSEPGQPDEPEFPGEGLPLPGGPGAPAPPFPPPPEQEPKPGEPGPGEPSPGEPGPGEPPPPGTPPPPPEPEDQPPAPPGTRPPGCFPPACLIPGDPGYPWEPNDPEYGNPYEPEIPIPSPGPEPIPPPPPPPPPPQIPPLPPGEGEKPKRPDFPVPKPAVAMGSLGLCVQGINAPVMGGVDPGKMFADLFAGPGLGQSYLQTWLQWLDPDNLKPGAALGGFFENVQNFVSGFAKSLQTAIGCADAELAGLITQQLVNGFLERWITDIPDYVTRPSEYRANFLCPNIIPNTPEAIAAYLGNEISQSVLECWTRSNGNAFPEIWRVMRSQRNKLVPQDLIALLRRKEINDEQYRERVRENGYLDNEADEFNTLSEPIPGIQDLVRLMVRDVEDRNIVDRFDLDAEFEDKWTGKLKEWGEWQGFTEEIAKRYWRAHWEIPSPTQLYEMFHRLRNRPEGDPSRVTEEDIRTALQQQDIAPYWIDKFLEISFNPLTRVDVRRAFDIGVLTRDRVKSAYTDLGYNEENAETLAEFAERVKLRRGVTEAESKRYIAGLVTGADWDAGMLQRGYTEEELDKIRPQVKRLAEVEVAKKCVPSIRRRFLLGELDAETSRKTVLNWVNDAEQADRLVRGWICERDARGKQLPLTKISSMFRDGILTIDQVFERLLNLNYDPTDAGLIIKQLEFAAQRDATKKEQQALRERQRQEEKARKQAEKAAKESEKRLKQAASLAEQNQRRLDGYRKSAMTTAKILADVYETDFPDEYNALWNLKNQLVREFQESEPFVLAVLATAAKSESVESRDEYIADVRRIVSAGEDAFQDSLLNSSNGSS